jgi:hypothetical protein
MTQFDMEERATTVKRRRLAAARFSDAGSPTL